MKTCYYTILPAFIAILFVISFYGIAYDINDYLKKKTCIPSEIKGGALASELEKLGPPDASIIADYSSPEHTFIILVYKKYSIGPEADNTCSIVVRKAIIPSEHDIIFYINSNCLVSCNLLDFK